jgi:glutamine amidotransferase
MNNKVSILDCGLGNIGSIQKMINKVGGKSEYIHHPEQIKKINKLIIPGVGNFDYGIKIIEEMGFRDVICDCVTNNNVIIMGICLGMQLLCKKSEEGVSNGLGLINAQVKKFCFEKNSFKIPHMGWNIVKTIKDNAIIPKDEHEQRYYFVHSYHVVPEDKNIIIGVTYYGGEFCSAFNKNNIYGVQFHPEKSHRFGLGLMKRFVEL